MNSQLFPLGVAMGAAFCNRSRERELLATNISQCRHTLITSPRRYGKTSLVLNVVTENSIPATRIDFLLAGTEYEVEQLIVSGVEKLASKLLTSPKKALEKLTKYLGSFKPELLLGSEGIKIKLTPSTTPKQSIVDILMSLDTLATNEKKQCTIIMDEFQQISSLKNNLILEAAIRHAAELAKSTCYIFSGSNRHLLTQMFDNDTRPLYNLCERLALERITADHYKTFLQKLAVDKWQDKLSEQALTKIFALTKLHPYYVNVLCSRLWREENIPSDLLAEKIWKQFCEEEKRRLTNQLGALSPNQRTIFAALAKNPCEHPTGQIFLTHTKLSTASANQSLQVLFDNDMIFRDQNNFVRPLDPAAEYIIANLE